MGPSGVPPGGGGGMPGRGVAPHKTSMGHAREGGGPPTILVPHAQSVRDEGKGFRHGVTGKKAGGSGME